MLLEELDDELRVLGSSALPRDNQVRSLAAARRRVWLTMAALGSRPHGLRSWAGLRGAPAQRVSARGVLCEPAAVVGRACFFVLRSAWWTVRAVMRLAYTLRAIWP